MQGTRTSDGLTLEQRDAKSRELLAKAGIEESTLTLERAVELHSSLDDKNIRTAIRVVSATNCFAELATGESVHHLLSVYMFQLAGALMKLGKREQILDIKSAFVKAAQDASAFAIAKADP